MVGSIQQLLAKRKSPVLLEHSPPKSLVTAHDTIIRVNDHPLGRHYRIGDHLFPSVTNVLGYANDDKSEALAAWRARIGDAVADQISKVASNRGTAVHNALEQYLNNEEIRLSGLQPDARRLFVQIADRLDRMGLSRILCSERFLVSESLGCAGAVDLICNFASAPNRNIVVDFKTSKKQKSKKDIESYFTQLFCYTTAFEEQFGINIDAGIILIGVDSLNTCQVFTLTRSEIETQRPKYLTCYQNYRKALTEHEQTHQSNI